MAGVQPGNAVKKTICYCFHPDIFGHDLTIMGVQICLREISESESEALVTHVV